MNNVGATPRKQGKSDCENSSNNMSSEHVWFMAQIRENRVQAFFVFSDGGREGGVRVVRGEGEGHCEGFPRRLR